MGVPAYWTLSCRIQACLVSSEPVYVKKPPLRSVEVYLYSLSCVSKKCDFYEQINRLHIDPHRRQPTVALASNTFRAISHENRFTLSCISRKAIFRGEWQRLFTPETNLDSQFLNTPLQMVRLKTRVCTETDIFLMLIVIFGWRILVFKAKGLDKEGCRRLFVEEIRADR